MKKSSKGDIVWTIRSPCSSSLYPLVYVSHSSYEKAEIITYNSQIGIPFPYDEGVFS